MPHSEQEIHEAQILEHRAFTEWSKTKANVRYLRGFSTRSWGDRMIHRFKEQVERFGKGQPITESDRKRTMPEGELGPCQHTHRNMFEVENAHGIWGVEICVDCGQLVNGPECPHVHCSWHLEGAILVCDNCGTDCT